MMHIQLSQSTSQLLRADPMPGPAPSMMPKHSGTHFDSREA